MPSPDLLITGATGFIGFKVLLRALEQGYTVRAAVRSAEKAKTLSSHPKITATGNADKLSFVEVPDITRDGAYDEAIRDIGHVIHLAAPLLWPSNDPQTGIYEPTIRNMSTLLASASKEPSVKKLVITSSIAGNMTLAPDPSQEITAETRIPDLPGPFDSSASAYNAAKVGALNYLDRFMAEKKPSFALAIVLPGLLFGRDERALHVKELYAGTNVFLLRAITGQPAYYPVPDGIAHVDDAVKVLLAVLKDGVVGNFGVTKVHSVNEAWAVITKHFPQAVARGTFTRGTYEAVPANWNAHQTEIDLGFNFQAFDDIVIDVANQYLELSGLEKA
ncbi:hypothetical protein CDD82_679 [Ophiocordyceps australis]|uniref:NAD-dependent epimerase/dehydratase domain-containing protein n=1 Tax=Ophiocordyceps australis TaxID=1399860 RepID=A0A2C5YLA9_9HYPO|nr:hypothetical protein CDD82_679 [Ophiocordyceps australis]